MGSTTKSWTQIKKLQLDLDNQASQINLKGGAALRGSKMATSLERGG